KNKAAVVQMKDKLSTFKFTSLFVGGHHVCGFDLDGVVICEGNNDWGQTNVSDRTPHAFTSLALGINHTWLCICMSVILPFMLTRGALCTKSSLEVETNNSLVEEFHHPTRSSRQLVMKIIELTLGDLNIATNRFSP
ncbi:putative serine/threonine-protein kinase-like protein CCR3, partial [Tanacetum coccineum]